MNTLLPLSLTIASGLFIMLGTFLVFIVKNNEKFISFSISMAFGVIISLIILELIPEAIEHINLSNQYINYLVIVIFGLVGFLSLKLLDMIVPHHHDHEQPHKDKNDNLFHIGLVSTIALIVHNIIEGMTIYSTAKSSLHLGVLISLGIGLHNIPLGIITSLTFYKVNKSTKKTLLISLLITISTFIGGLIMSFMNISEIVSGIMLSLTLGMLTYISLFELFPKIYHNKKRSILGIIIGILIFLSSLLFHSH